MKTVENKNKQSFMYPVTISPDLSQKLVNYDVESWNAALGAEYKQFSLFHRAFRFTKFLFIPTYALVFKLH